MTGNFVAREPAAIPPRHLVSMANPRIVGGREGLAFGVRGHARDDTFVIGISKDARYDCPRGTLEDRLMEEASSLIRELGRSDGFDWSKHHFERNPDFDVGQKVLSQTELDHLLSG